MAKRKNAAAVALGRKGAKARLKSLTPEQRSTQARKAVQTRWRNAKPSADPQPPLWYGLFVFDALNQPEVLMWSRDRDELRSRASIEEGVTVILPVPYNPTKFNIIREFQFDGEAQLEALQTAIDGSRK